MGAEKTVEKTKNGGEETGGKDKKYNRNVVTILFICGAWGLADSIWNGTILAAYIYALVDDGSGEVVNATNGTTSCASCNQKVGWVECTQGLASLFVSFPAGYIADKKGRSGVSKIGGACYVLATILTTITLLYPQLFFQRDPEPIEVFYLLTGISALWGFGQGILNGPLYALFADSVRESERSKCYTYLFISYVMPLSVGPAISIGLLVYYGQTTESWSTDQLKPVFCVGVLMELIPASATLLLSDRYSLKEDEDGDVKADTANELEAEQHSETDIKDQSKPGQTDSELKDVLADDQASNSDAATDQKNTPPKRGGCLLKAAPYLMFTSNLMFGIASGMTVKFFPLFFGYDLNMEPEHVQIIYVVSPIVMCIFSWVAEKASKTLGRVQVILGLYYVGISCLVTMAVLYYADFYRWNIIWIYVLRTSLMNCSYPLQESVLLELVPKKTRARWKSLESISSLGWCGSALLGGVIADQNSYAFTFILTAGLQFLATLFWLPFFKLVPVKQPDAKKPDDETSDDKNEEESKSQENRKQNAQIDGQDKAIAATETSTPNMDHDNLTAPLLGE